MSDDKLPWRGAQPPLIIPSARKHGIADEDMFHAFAGAMRIEDLGDGFTMITGPDRAANFLEIGVVDGDPIPVVVHAMRCRPQFLPGKPTRGSR